MTATFGTIGELILDSFCVLGCGGDVGLIYVGLASLVVFILIMFKMNLGMDGVVVAGGFFLIIMSAAGYLPSWTGALPWIGAAILWVSAIWLYARR